MNSFEFEIKDKFDLSFGPAVVLKYLGDLNFDSLKSVNGVKILNIQMPRKVDENGKLKKGYWVFHLDKTTDLNNFHIGQIVKAK